MAKRSTTKQGKRAARHAKIRKRLSGTLSRPRLAVYRSNKHLYAQLIDDVTGKTIAAAHDFDIKKKMKKQEISAEVGTLIALKAKAKNITTVVFDRGGFLYAGRVKALAEGARKAGLEF